MERWRRPLKILDVLHPLDAAEHAGIPEDMKIPVEMVDFNDGVGERMKMIPVFDEESIERLRLGHACLECYEPFETAFPESCHLCGYKCKKRQTSDFGKRFLGNMIMNPQYKRMIERVDELTEEVRIEHYARTRDSRAYIKDSKISVEGKNLNRTPGGIVLPPNFKSH